MNIQLSSDALADLEEGFSFYRQQAPGLGSYFIACLTAEMEALAYYGGIHQVVYGFHRAYQGASLSVFITPLKPMV
jgi:hypothetical protein